MAMEVEQIVDGERSELDGRYGRRQMVDGYQPRTTAAEKGRNMHKLKFWKIT